MYVEGGGMPFYSFILHQLSEVLHITGETRTDVCDKIECNEKSSIAESLKAGVDSNPCAGEQHKGCYLNGQVPDVSV